MFALTVIPEGLKSFLKAPISGEDSLKRLVSWMAAAALIIFGYGLLLTMEVQATLNRPIDPVLRDCFIAVVGFIATLAMVAYRKADAAKGGDDAATKV